MIAIVTLIFLPPSLMAAIFGMVGFNMENGRILVSPEYVGWFVGLSALFIVVIWAGWYLTEWIPKWRLQRMRRRSDTVMEKESYAA